MLFCRRKGRPTAVGHRTEDALPAPGPDTTAANPLAAMWQPVQRLPGIGPRRAAELRRLGIEDLWDLCNVLPRSYRDLRQVQPLATALPGVETVFRVRIAKAPRRIRGRFWRAEVEDASGSAELYWFSRGLPGPAQELEVGDERWIVGKPDRRKLVPIFSHPRLYDAREALRIEPLYRGMPWLGGLIGRSVREEAGRLNLADPLPSIWREAWKVPPLGEALAEIHTPPDGADLEALAGLRSPGFRRIAADTFLAFFLGLGLRRRALRAVEAPANRFLADDLQAIKDALPFELTGDQRAVLREVLAELQRTTPMYRLVQADVGAGKTAVALVAAAAVAKAGGQTAVLAPTEILAGQHTRVFDAVLGGLGIRIARLTGSLPEARKRELRFFVESGNVDIVIGTHALLVDELKFRDLRLVVIDEEQRYGVAQRSLLRAKGGAPHTLLLTATPIPRSLALSLLGETDVSTIREKPAGRAPVATEIVPPTGKRKVLAHIRRELEAGHKVFFLYPRVDAEGAEDDRSVVAMHARLAEYFGADRVGLLHGRMAGDDKDRMLRSLRDGRLQILVSTSVIEVGVDVPDATILVIGHPETFGLAQLHQIRGRIGRGSLPGTCYLLVETDIGEESLKRLEVLVSTSDGFEIAEADLELRGSGAMLGTRQSGMPDIHPSLLRRFADLAAVIREDAAAILDADPQLLDPAWAGVREVLARKWSFPIGEVAG